MSQSSGTVGNGTQIRRERVNSDAAIGLCLACSHRITLCGKPFTADIECNKCHTINHFNNSQQPVATGGNTAHG
jgi:hypothetical protein